MADRELVAVVIPAHNARATIDATLSSARAQTYQQIEIVVVDDGSTDATAASVERHIRADPRVKLLRREHAGVAAARNAGIAHSRAAFIAPLDADDLWDARKIEKQMQVMHNAGPEVGLVYTWTALVDWQGQVTGVQPAYRDEGDVLRSLCRGNIVGSGSNPLIRAAAVHKVGGYDQTLMARGAQGCEDHALYLAIAEYFHYALVPEYLTGYRQGAMRLSTDIARMKRCGDMVAAALEARRPDLWRFLRERHANAALTAYREALMRGAADEASAICRQFVRSMPLQAFKALVARPVRDALTFRPSRHHLPDIVGKPFLSA
jgi:glycosyltransferase involved in cell wall biosynthesis